MRLDPDLAALHEARTLVSRAVPAAENFARFDASECRRIAEIVCRACEDRAEYYAKWALKETGIGRLEDKVTKNLVASRNLMDFYQDTPLGGVRVDAENKMLLVARPAGVVMGLIASTSPIATLYFKILSCLLTRNAIILSPHPLALHCSIDATEYLSEVAQRAGAPVDVIQIQKTPTLDSTHAMMRNAEVNLILATGGSPMVRAAYASGNPALGVGPGNVPVYVDVSADIDLAASEILEAKCFDYGSPCSAPSVVFVHRDIADQLENRMRRSGAYFCDAEQQARLEAFAFPNGRINTEIVGRSASCIADQAGLKGASGKEVLVGTIKEISPTSPMAREKLSPILGIKRVDSKEQAIRDANAMLTISGAGHTSGIFSQDPEVISLWGCAVDVNRTVVNKGTTMGSGGEGNKLTPSFTIGTGFAGRSSIAENVGPQHLINWKRIAFPVDDSGADSHISSTSQPTGRGGDVDIRVKEAIQAVLKALDVGGPS